MIQFPRPEWSLSLGAFGHLVLTRQLPPTARYKMRRTVTIFALGLASLVGGAILVLFVSPASVVVRNDSDQTVTGISVAVQEHTLNFPDLAPGHSARRWFRNAGPDGNYSLIARRSDGTQIREEEGYITGGGFYSAAQFTIEPSGNVAFTENYR